MLQSTKNNVNRDRYFECITQNVGRKKVGLRSVQDVDGKVHNNREKIEHKLRDYNKIILVK